jgi:hypothetical protein
MLPIATPDDERAVWSPSLLATAEFFRSVEASEKANLTIYARPVRWIVSARAASGGKVLVAFSPYEVNELLPLIRASKRVHLHVYAPRVVQTMHSFSDLRFYVIPRLPLGWSPPTVGMRSQLNVFAGQLYFEDYATYVELCAFLGISSPESERLYGSTSRIEKHSDGFIPRDRRKKTSDLERALESYNQRSFGASPVHTLRQHISTRRNGMEFVRTHIGQLLHGRHLKKDDFDKIEVSS